MSQFCEKSKEKNPLKVSKWKLLKKKLGALKHPFVSISFILLAVECFTLIYALFWALGTSLKTLNNFSEDMFGIPRRWEFTNYIRSYLNLYYRIQTIHGSERIMFVELLRNSLLYATFPVFISVFSHATVAYVACKYRFSFNKVLHFCVIFVMVFPSVNSLGATLAFLKSLGFYDNYWAVLYGKVNFASGAFLIWVGCWKGIPTEYMEAAKIDGAGHWYIYLKIMLPLARVPFTILMATGFIGAWNNFQEPLTTMPSMPNLALALWKFQWLTTNSISWPPVQMATAIIVATPCVIIYCFVQPHLVGNLTAGGLKG